MDLQVTTLFRALMNEAGIEWAKCAEYGARFNDAIERADNISTDTSKIYRRDRAWDEELERLNSGYYGR